MDLRTVRHFIWKQTGDLTLHYRPLSKKDYPSFSKYSAMTSGETWGDTHIHSYCWLSRQLTRKIGELCSEISTGETINKILLFVSFTPKKPAVLLQFHVIELLILQTSVFNLSCKGQSALHTFFQVLIIYKRLRFETRQQALSSHEKVLFPVTRVQFSIWCRRWH